MESRRKRRKRTMEVTVQGERIRPKGPLSIQGGPLSPRGDFPNSKADDLLSSEDLELEFQVDQAGFLDAEHTQKQQTVQMREEYNMPTIIPAHRTTQIDQMTEEVLLQMVPTTDINMAELQPTPGQRNPESGTEKQKHESRNDVFPPELPPRHINTQAKASEQDKSKESDLHVDDRRPQHAVAPQSLQWIAVQLIRSLIRSRVPEGYKRITRTCVSHSYMR
jgi:hypothetical protein